MDHDHHHHGHSHGSKKKNSLRFRLLQIFISLIILALTPLLISFVTDNTIESVRDQYQANFVGRDDKIYTGKVIDVETEETSVFGQDTINQILTVSDTEASQDDLKVDNLKFANTVKVSEGDKIFFVASFNEQSQSLQYNFVDIYRLDTVIWLLVIFVLLVILLAGLKGINGFIGLGFTTIIIFSYLLPEILAGNSIFLSTLIAAFFITGFSFYLSHGFNKPTSIAVFATFITITITIFGSLIVENLMNFSGVSSHELSHIQSLQTLNDTNLDLRSLFIASIILGTLGVLDDVTVSQAFIVDELHKANPKQTVMDLFLAAIRIGKEHIISLINTLTLAYFATGIPFVIQYILFGYNDITASINSEVISGEIVRTIIGSMSLFLAIPITTIIAAYMVKNDIDIIKLLKRKKNSNS